MGRARRVVYSFVSTFDRVLLKFLRRAAVNLGVIAAALSRVCGLLIFKPWVSTAGKRYWWAKDQCGEAKKADEQKEAVDGASRLESAV